MNYRELPLQGKIHAFLDISVDDVKCGRVVVELFKNHVPKTVENFRALCTGERGIGVQGFPLHYKNSIFHKAVPECIVQGGDITKFDGSGGESIYGNYFEDESMKILHSDYGLLSMANCGKPDTNNSQFCVTLGENCHLDNNHVVFGRVVKGFNIINDISYQPLDSNFRPIPVCKIWNCGELRPGEDWAYCDKDFNDVYPPYPTDWDYPLTTNILITDIIDVVKHIKEAGNRFFKEGRTLDAHQKYKKSMRYIDWYLTKIKDEEAKYPSRDLETLMQLQTDCRLNAALACIKLDCGREAVHYCNEVLKAANNKNKKALYRRALAKEKLNDHQDALRDLHAALRLSPGDGAILEEISRIKCFLKNYKQKERLRCARMFKI